MTQTKKIYNIVYTKKADKQLDKINDKKLLLKLESIIEQLKINPYAPVHKFERLKGKGTRCSMRLTQKDRLYYEVFDDKVLVLVLSILGHYEDH